MMLLAAGLAGCGEQSTSSAQPVPVLVQIENGPDSRPQWGLQQADVVYEYVTEGGITRFSALYTSPPDVRVGPVRSARLVTVHLAGLYGAVIVYSGASTYVQQRIDGSKAAHVDEVSAQGDLLRVDSRPPPHNLVSDGSHLHDLLQRVNAPAARWSLWNRTSDPLSGGRPATSVVVPFSEAEHPLFTYDAGLRGWQRSERDSGTFVDATTGMPLHVGTLIVQQVRVAEVPDDVEDSSGALGVDITLTGSGTAQVFTAGREYDAAWSQPGQGPPRLSTGTGPAPIAAGPVWICLLPQGTTATVVTPAAR